MVDFIDNTGIIVCRADNVFDRAAGQAFVDWFGEKSLNYLRAGRFTCVIPEDRSGCAVGLEFPELPRLPQNSVRFVEYRRAVLVRLAVIEAALGQKHPLRAEVLAEIAAERDRLTVGVERAA